MLTKEDIENKDGYGKSYIRHKVLFVGKDSQRNIKDYINQYSKIKDEQYVSTFSQEHNGYFIHAKSKQGYFNIRLGIESIQQLQLIF